MHYGIVFPVEQHGRSLIFVDDVIESHFTVNMIVMVLSLTGSLLVLLSGLFFPDIVRKKTLSWTIMLVSFSNLMTSIALAMGFPTGAACTVQGIISNFGIKGSWFSVMIVCHQLRKTITTGKLSFNSQQTLLMYIAYQIFSVLYIFAIGYDFGIAKQLQGKAQCGYYAPSNLHESQIVNRIVGFLIFEYLMMIVLIYEIFIISRYVSALKIPEYYNKVNALKQSAWLYPIFMLIVWTPLSIFFLIIGIKGINNYTAYPKIFSFGLISASWSFLDGFFNALVYFYNGKGVRELWYKLLSNYAIGRIYLSAFAWIQGKVLACIKRDDTSENPLADQDIEATNKNITNRSMVVFDDFLDNDAMENVLKSVHVHENQNKDEIENEVNDIDIDIDIELSTRASQIA